MVDTSQDGLTTLWAMHYDARRRVADLIGECLEHAGEWRFDGRAGGFRVIVGQSRYEAHIVSYYVECTSGNELAAGALRRYADALGLLGWYVADPGPIDSALLVEVIGDELLERAPTWLCQKWEALHDDPED